MHTRSKDIASWLRERVAAAGAGGLVVGLSGGLDSAVVARLCQIAMPDAAVGVIMPCHSDPQDEADARLLADHFKLTTVRIDLAPTFDHLVGTLNGAAARLPVRAAAATRSDEVDLKGRVPLANVKARLRMTSLYFVANSLNYLVAGTGNRCELTIGYFTKYGDGAADVLPIGDLLKSEVASLARDLGVPESLIEKPPSAGLWAGQSDEQEIGFTYRQLERYLADGPEAVPPALALRIERLVRQTSHKRALAPTPASDSIGAEH
jgi:NAD+ synthase